jgi:hypothetical protein
VGQTGTLFRLMDESTRDLMAERLGPTSLGLVCHGNR